MSEYRNLLLESLAPAALTSNSNIIGESGFTDRPRYPKDDGGHQQLKSRLSVFFRYIEPASLPGKEVPGSIRRDFLALCSSSEQCGIADRYLCLAYLVSYLVGPLRACHFTSIDESVNDFIDEMIGDLAAPRNLGWS